MFCPSGAVRVAPRLLPLMTRMWFLPFSGLLGVGGAVV